MSDWKLIRRETKAGNDWTIRSLRLPKDLDDYCNQQGNASDFIRDLIRRHKQGIVEEIGLTDEEDDIRRAFESFYMKQHKWKSELLESGEIYPAPEKLTDEQTQQLINALLNDVPGYILSFRARELLERCKTDKGLWLTIYTKIRDWNWQLYLRDEKDK